MPSESTMTRPDRHKLWWKRGEHGRGLFYPATDTVVTWPEDEMDHDDRHVSLVSIEDPCTEGDDDRVEFNISPEGVLQPYCLSRQQAERVLELVPSLEPPRYWG